MMMQELKLLLALIYDYDKIVNSIHFRISYRNLPHELVEFQLYDSVHVDLVYQV